MTWSDIPKNPSTRTLRQFAAAWLVVLVAAGALQYWRRGHPTAGSVMVGLGIVFGVLGLWRPQAIRWLFVGASVVTFPIGWVVSQLVLAIMFYVILTPIAAVLRLRGRDLLARKRRPERASLWVPKTTPSDVRRYFRQY